MDPVANIKEQKEIAERLLALIDSPRRGGTVKNLPSHDIERLAELVLALDEWRTKGGFDPYAATS